MTKTLHSFLRSEEGATLVDMTMLMAAIAGLALAVTTTMSIGNEDLTSDQPAPAIAQAAVL
ncbi:hypothetical protein [uncultured Litoreibacter sp.]|uniref:hypothetical protein n=1 Tax=uncultured Litoreibacter sp. TaxID=1392394 RepID=UPI002602CE65|nr:hypothetical protein [uncultured Litoreibacter sp.]